MALSAWSSFNNAMLISWAINIVTLALVIADILPGWAFFVTLIAGVCFAVGLLIYRASTNGYRNNDGDVFAPDETTPGSNT